jgi:hypothetical protein
LLRSALSASPFLRDSLPDCDDLGIDGRSHD